MIKKKKKPIVPWSCDIQFWGGLMKVRARTEGEARRKMFKRLRDNPKLMYKWLNKSNSYVDKMY